MAEAGNILQKRGERGWHPVAKRLGGGRREERESGAYTAYNTTRLQYERWRDIQKYGFMAYCTQWLTYDIKWRITTFGPS